MFRTALRNVLAHKARLSMTVLAVMLGVAFVSGTLVFTNTISEAPRKSSAKGFDHVAPTMPTYELVLPWARMAVFPLLAAAVGILAALWPARRAAGLNMLTAIKSE